MQRLGHIDALRGFAAAAVCWYHISQGGNMVPEGPLRWTSSLGHLGVEIFFVISGFVIPLSMWNEGYRWNHFPSFMRRRMLRVHPPFLIASILAIVLNLISMSVPGYAGSLPDPYLPQALVSLALDGTYSSGFLSRPWILVVAWTLAIEVQFYLLAALLVHFMRPERPYLLGSGLLVLSCFAFFLTDTRWIFPYLPFFAAGWGAAWIHVSSSRRILPAAVSAVLLALLLGRSLPSAAAALASFAFILFWRWKIAAPWKLLGAISYSLYLVHVPVGGRVVNLLSRFADNPAGRWGILALAMIISLVAAWIFWRLVESPLHRLSRRDRKSSDPCPLPSEPCSSP
jgi:peptidoglycan/LPS O-acetylase OafA/YrhL